ncbi:MAG TPA: hypothetical protein VGW57_16725 [Chthoniobacterales bacterium]|nr:hypothetical protein [Chthoniobacterales bacterium]
MIIQSTKRSILASGLVLGSLLLVLSGTDSDGGAETETTHHKDVVKTQPANQSEGRNQAVYDIDGKRLRSGEKYAAAISFENGRVVAYRKNRREIAALVTALKQGGITDKKRLDPNAWLMNICGATVESGCNGGCGIGYHCKGFRESINRPISNQHATYYMFCFCVPN